MRQVIDRLLEVGVFKHSNHNVAVATKAVAYLVRLMLVVCDKSHVVSSTDRAVGSALKDFHLGLCQLVAGAKQIVVAVGFGPFAAAFGSANRRGSGCSNGGPRSSSFLTGPLGSSGAFGAGVVAAPGFLGRHEGFLYRAFYTTSYPRFSQAQNTSVVTA